MAANTVVKSSANTLTQLDDDVQNPDVNGVNGGAKNMYITLEIRGVNVDAGDVMRSLKTIGADVSAITPVVTVASNKDSNNNNVFILEVGPT